MWGHSRPRLSVERSSIFFGRHSSEIAPKTTKPGWLARLSHCGTGSSVFVGSASQNVSISVVTASYCSVGCACRTVNSGFRSKVSTRKQNPPNLRYITIARFSNSCWRTGIAQPAISTRPAASSAAVGETP